MSFWLRQRYGCTHPGSNRFFSEAQYSRCGGICPGSAGYPCGLPLQPAESLDLRPHLLLAVLSLAVMLFFGWHTAFPPPLTGIAFATPESSVSDSVGLVDIEVERGDGLDRAVSVAYETSDGSARAGEDYAAVRGELRFAAGEARKRLSVVVLTDTTMQKPARDFRVNLPGVQGQPSHRIVVAVPLVERSDAQTAERAARAASVTAKDIADLFVREHTLNDLLAQTRQQPGEFAIYQRLLQVNGGNLSRARESYLVALEDLRKQPPRTVLDAMDRVIEDLNAREFVQQAKTVIIMKRHYGELVSGQRPDMDRWAKELSLAVPDPELKDATEI